jgi:Fic family protein
MNWTPSLLPFKKEIETKLVLKKVASAHRALAELKGVAQSIPKQEILINTLVLQEAKDSSEVENIVTTHDELYKSTLHLTNYNSPQSKEVQNYIAALKKGFEIVKSKKMLTTNDILIIQEVLENNNAGLRKLPGTTLKNQQTGKVVYEPPQNSTEIKLLMKNLELFINDDSLADYDPIVKMAVIHFQFESIHPFYDGNGRTGRIINILYLVMCDLLDLPILYLSRYIIQNKSNYYRLLQSTRDTNNWEEWLLFMVESVEYTAIEALNVIQKIKNEMQKMKLLLRSNFKFYSQELLNHLFKQPYTKIEFLVNDINVSRVTAAIYLNSLAENGVLEKQKIGKSNYYINHSLIKAITNV